MLVTSGDIKFKGYTSHNMITWYIWHDFQKEISLNLTWLTSEHTLKLILNNIRYHKSDYVI